MAIFMRANRMMSTVIDINRFSLTLQLQETIMDQRYEILLLAVIAIILVSIESIQGRFLLVKINQPLPSESPKHGLKIVGRVRHQRCWDCIEDLCKRFENDKYVRIFKQECEPYADESKYQYKKYLVQCGILQCYKAKYDIRLDCLEGGIDGTLEKVCSDNN